MKLGKIGTVVVMIANLIFFIPTAESAGTDTVTNNFIVVSSDGAPVIGAQIQVAYYSKKVDSGGFSAIAVTDSSGKASVSYPNDTYATASVVPADTGAPLALGFAENVDAYLGEDIRIELLPGDVKFNVKNADGTDAAVGTSLSYVGGGFTLTRTGNFYLNASTFASDIKNSPVYIFPSESNLQAKENRFYVKKVLTGSQWNISLFSDAGLTSEVTKNNGSYNLAFKSAPIEFQLKNAAGADLTIPSNVKIYLYVFRVNENLEYDVIESDDESGRTFSSSGKAYLALGTAGRYAVQVQTVNSTDLPSFNYYNLWSDGHGGFSTTSASSGFTTGSGRVNLNFPAKTLKFKVTSLEEAQVYTGNIEITEKVNGQYVWSSKYANSVQFIDGYGVLYLPNNEYKIRIISNGPDNFPENTYYATVNDSGYTIKNSNSETIVSQNGVVPLTSGQSNLKLRVMSGGNTVSGAKIYYEQNGTGYGLNSRDNGNSYIKLDDGTVEIRIESSALLNPPKADIHLQAVVANGQITSLFDKDRNANIVKDAQNFYAVNFIEPNLIANFTDSSGAKYADTQVSVFNQNSDGGWVNFLNPFTNNAGSIGIKVPAGKYRFTIGSKKSGTTGTIFNQECIAVENAAVTCNLAVPTNNLKLKVSNQGAETFLSNVSITLSGATPFDNSFSTGGWIGGYKNEISLGLFDGIYSLRIQPQNWQASNVGAENYYHVEVRAGSIYKITEDLTDQVISPTNGTYILSSKKTNFSGIAKVGSLPAPYTFVQFALSNGKRLDKSAFSGSDGKFSQFLEDGDYVLTLISKNSSSSSTPATKYSVLVENGIVTSVKNSSGTTIAPVDNEFSMPFDTANVTGTVLMGGKKANGNLWAQQLNSNGKSDFASLSSSLDSNSNFSLKLSPGTYVLNLNSWDNESNSQISVISDLCIVPVSGNVVCNMDIPSSNLKFSLATSSNLQYNGSFYTVVKRIFSNGFEPENCCNYGKNAVNNLSLMDGDYLITIVPNDQTSDFSQAGSYKVKVASNAVVSIVEATTNIAPTSNSGVYQLKLGAPGAVGIVLAPDGTTPVAGVYISIQGQKTGSGAYSDKNGRFAIQKMLDDTYDVWANSNWQDISLYNSEIQQITLVNGISNTQISLQLRQPNITVRVQNPNGNPYANQWINIQKLDVNGFYQYQKELPGRSTNSNGQFSYLLSPGTYIFETNSDTSNGGVKTVSAPCVITSTIPNCDFTLKSANLKLSIKDSSGKAMRDTYAHAWIQTPETNPANTYRWMNSNTLGLAEANLPNGKWYLRVDAPWNDPSISSKILYVTISNNEVQEVVDQQGNALLAENGIYSIVMPATNLSGSIFENSTLINYSTNVTLKRLSQENNYYPVETKWSSTGKFGFKAEPGTYVIEAQPSPYYLSNYATTKSQICVVPATGTVTCDVNLRQGNLLGLIMGSDSANYHEFSATLYTVNEKGETWEQGVPLFNGNFSLYLADGKYRILVQPYWEKRSLYSNMYYEIVVTSGSITSVINSLNASTVNSIDGRYQFVIAAPGVKGIVLEPGTSTNRVSNIEILPFDTSGKELWKYATNSDVNGEFGLALPPGSYDLMARVWSNTDILASSAKVRIVVDSTGQVAGNIEMRLRAPNFFGTVVKPGTTEPLAKMNVNVYANGEYFYTWTNSTGKFGGYIENALPNPCTNCVIYISPNNSSEYTQRRYTFNSIGNLGNLEIGSVNTHVSVNYPNGNKLSPASWTYISVEEISNGNYFWQPGSGTNELGVAGLSLETGKKYRLTAYPDWQKSGEFSPKSVVIDSFSLPNNELIAITFDTANTSFTVRNSAGVINSWARYEVYEISGASKAFLKDGYLNEQGKGSLALTDGNFEIKIWPGKAAGSAKVIQVSVISGVATVNGASGLNLNLILPNGNFSGQVIESGLAVEKVTVVAYKHNDPTFKVVAITNASGIFEMTLDASVAWDFVAVNPISGAKGVATYSDPTKLSNEAITLTDIGIS